MDTKIEHHEEKKITKPEGTEKVETHIEHTSHGEEHEEFAATAHAIEQRFRFKEVIIFLIILALGMVAAWGINKAVKNTDNKNEAAAPGDVELPTYETPRVADQNNNTNQGSSPAPSTTGDAMTHEEGSSSTGTQTARPAVVSSNYQNSGLGFSYQLPAGWSNAEAESTTNEIVFYDTLHQWVISSIEVYSNAGGETLDSLMPQLNNSSTIHNVHKVVINGKEWIEYDSSSPSFNHGLVTIHGNRIYYINGELSKPQFASTFAFK